jgi:hypothetical protein
MGMVDDVEFSKETAQHFWKLLNSREFRLQFKAASEQGEQAVRGVVQNLLEKVQ